MKRPNDGYLYFLFCVILSISLFSFLFVRLPEYSGEKFSPSVLPNTEKFLGVDFINIYAAANSVKAGLDPYKYNSRFGTNFHDPYAGGEWSRYTFGPLLAYFYIPLTLLPFEQAYKIWFWFCLFLLVFSVIYLAKLFEKKFMIFTVLIVLILSSYPLYFALERGASDFIILFFLSASCYLWKKNKNGWIPSIMISLAILSKLYPGILLLYFFLKHEWNVLKKIAITTFIFILLTFNFEIYKSAYLLIRYTSLNPSSWNVNHSMISFLRFIGLSYKLSSISSFILITFLIITSSIVIYKRKTIGFIFQFLEWGIFTILMCIIPSVSNDYKLILQLIPIAAVLFYYSKITFDKNKIFLRMIILILIPLLMVNTEYLFRTKWMTNKLPSLVCFWGILISMYLNDSKKYLKFNKRVVKESKKKYEVIQ